MIDRLHDIEPDHQWEVEQTWRLQEAMADADDERRLQAIASGDCICPEEPASRYSPGGIIEYLGDCPEHGDEVDSDDGHY
jgi:hypothetical protein